MIRRGTPTCQFLPILGGPQEIYCIYIYYQLCFGEFTTDIEGTNQFIHKVNKKIL